MLRISTLRALLVLGVLSSNALADDPLLLDQPDAEPEMGHPNIAFKTLGGRQFWGDVQFFQRFRIQQNVFTGHFRLLDDDDVRRAWGTLDECREKLAEIRVEKNLPAMQGKAVILLHGITRSSKHMSHFIEPLTAAGYTVFPMDYPSTRVSIQDSANYLHQVLGQLDGIDEINFVVHSMGGIVVRTYLQEHVPRDPRIKRLVMIGTPNNGANLANMLSEHANVLFKPIFGPAGQQLVADTDGFIAKLPKPDFEFAVIAGGRGDEKGLNPLIPGDDDGIVSVDSTRLPGAADSTVVTDGVCSTHTLLTANKNVVTSAVRFLTTGSLRESGERSPVP